MITINNIELSTIRSGKGDCIQLRFIGTQPRNIIIDTGPTSTSGQFRALYNSILARGETIDLLIITHYDDDHIGGILKLTMSESRLQINKAMFNAYAGQLPSSDLSARQGQRLFHELAGISYIRGIKGDILDIDGAKITVLAPTEEKLKPALDQMERAEFLSQTSDWHRSIDELKECPYPLRDSSISNQSSIVFVFEYQDIRMLFCGDASADIIVGGMADMDRRQFNLVKLPHHGSSRNVSEELFASLSSDYFLICADGTQHPNKQTIAKMLNHYDHIKILGNYSWWDDGFFLPADDKYRGRISCSLCERS